MKLQLLCVLFILSNSAAYANQSSSTQSSENNDIELSFDFNRGLAGWQTSFADYPVGKEAYYQLNSRLNRLPAEISTHRQGLLLSGTNRMSSLIMYLKKALTSEDGIEPNTDYVITYNITYASNAQSNCPGAPGEGVTLKAGGSTKEPKNIVDKTYDYWRINVEFGNKELGGINAGRVGNIANGVECDDSKPAKYVTLVKEYEHFHIIRSNEDAELWLLVGTDSSYQSTTALYYKSIKVKLVPDY